MRKDTTSKLDPPIQTDVDNQRVLLQVADYYHKTLKQSPEALKYLAARRLNTSNRRASASVARAICSAIRWPR